MQVERGGYRGTGGTLHAVRKRAELSRCVGMLLRAGSAGSSRSARSAWHVAMCFVHGDIDSNFGPVCSTIEKPDRDP